MEEELKQRAITILDAISEAAKTGIDLASQGVQELASQIVTYGIAIHGMSVIACLVALGVGGYLIYYTLKENTKSSSDQCEFCMALAGFSSIAFLLLGIVGTYFNLKNLLTAIFAPYIYIIQFVTNFGK